MRFLLKEQPYEKIVAFGSLQYEQNGRPIGMTESWRYTAALDGYHFLRVDVDGRQSSGHTCLYNLLLNRSGNPEQLKYRFFTKGHRVAGQLLFEDGEILAIHEWNGQRIEQVFMDTKSFWFPSAVGASLLRFSLGTKQTTWLNDSLNNCSIHCFSPIQVETAVQMEDNMLTIDWQNRWCKITLNQHGFTEMMFNSEGLTAVNHRSNYYSTR